MKKIYSYVSLILAFGSLVLSNKSAAQIMSFNTRTLISGVDNTVGATYRFSNVKTGVDAIVSIDSLLNGAVIKDIDKSGWGYLEAFQPFIQPPNNINTSAYAVFTMKFVTTATTTPVVIPQFSMTSLDIDGSNNIKEFDVIDMGGGTASYSLSPSEISISASWSAFRAINVSGIQHGGPDTTEKGDIFTVTKALVSQLTIKCGTVGTTNSNTSREYSFFPAAVSYPTPIFTLPLNLISFTATLNNEGNSADLKWTTANEYNVSHFVVEKSIDGKNFSDAATVFAAGSSPGEKNYAFSDKNINVSQRVYYYRLRSVDNDGKMQYSQVRMILLGQPKSTATITTFPNPVADELRITLPVEWQGKAVMFEVFGQNGQKIKGKSVSNSSQTETLNLNDLSRGIYIVRASFGTEFSVAKVIKN